MPGGLALLKRDPSEVDSAPAGKVWVFFDESGRLAFKDEHGAVFTPQALIASLETTVATKQDAATATTDGELSSAVAELVSAIATKQDAATAATDAELATERGAREAADATLTTASAAAQATADAALPKAGGTMTGGLTLSGDPAGNLDAAPKQYVLAQIGALINGAPGALDTLKEIADRLGSDESAVEALTATLAGKLGASSNLSDLTDAVAARGNLGLGSAALKASGDFDAAGAAAAEKARAEAAEALRATKAEVNIINLGTDWSAGDLLGARVSVPPAARKFDIRDGKTASPVTTPGVTLSVSRVDATTNKVIEDAGLGTDPTDGASVMRLSIKGTPSSQVQVSALVTSAWQTGEYAEPFADACPIIMLSRISGKATGRALGSYGEISIETTTARGGEVHELRVKNEAEAHAYVSNGPSKSMGTWTRAAGAFTSAAAHQVGEGVGGRTFDVAFGVNAGAVSGAAFRDDSSALRSILIKGSHEKAAVAIAKGAGQVVVGAETPATSTALIEVYSEVTADPLMQVGSDKAVNISNVIAKMSTGTLKAIAVGSAGSFMTGTAQGDVGLTFTAGKTFHIGASTKTSQLRIAEAGIGFYGTAPQTKPTGVAKTAEAIWTALNTLGLIA